MNIDDDDEEEMFDEDVYSYLDSDILKEYYISAHSDGFEKMKPEPMEHVKAWMIYITESNFIRSIVPLETALEVVVAGNTSSSSSSIVKSARWQEMVAEYSKEGRYRLFDVLVFNFTLEKTLIDPFLHSTTTTTTDHLKSVLGCLQEGKDLVLEPSLIFFHQMNHMYFIYKKE